LKRSESGIIIASIQVAFDFAKVLKKPCFHE
jgi:hypothetical protein